MKWLLSLLALLVLGYVALAAAMYVFQRKLQYFPTHRKPSDEELALFKEWRSKDEEFLGYVKTPQGKPAGAVVFFHGNGGEAIDRAWMSLLIPKNYFIFLPEYPGYGPKSGETTESSLFEAATRQIESARLLTGLPLIVIGESLGTGVASYVASQPHVSKLILISPFSSALDVAKQAYGFLPVSLLMKDRFESQAHLSRATHVPLLIFHGQADSVIPISLSRKLFDEFGGKKAMKEIPGANHNDIVEFLLREPAASAFLSFVAS